MFHHFFLGGAVQGIEALNPSLTINSITETPVFRYKGGDATLTTWPPWTYGTTLSFVDTGTDPTLNAGSAAILTGRFDKSVQFNNACYYDNGSDDTTFDITTEDFVLEIVYKAAASASTYFNKRSTANKGIHLRTAAGTTIQVTMTDAADTDTASIVTVASSQTAGQWYHYMLFVDRSGSAQGYLNGVASGVATSVTSVGSLTTASPIGIGCLRDTGTTFCDNGNVMYLAGWKRNTWLDTHLQGTVALARYTALTKGQALV